MTQDDADRRQDAVEYPPVLLPPPPLAEVGTGLARPTAAPAPTGPAAQSSDGPAYGRAPGYSAPPLPATQPWPTSLVSDQRPVDPALAVVAWVLAVVTAAYMLPWAIAVTRGKCDAGAIGLLNLLLGWSVVGWIVALVMAFLPHRVVRVPVAVNVAMAQQAPQGGYGVPAPPVRTGPAAGWYPSPDGLGRQYWDGRSWTGHRAP